MKFDLDFFRQQGYQVCRGVLNASEIQVLHALLAQAQVQACQELQSALELPELSDLGAFMSACEREPARFEALPLELRQLLVGHFSLETRLDPVLWTIPRSAGIQALLAEIFPGQRVGMHMPPTARFILPGHRWSGVPVHQDISYNRHMQDFVTIWLPLVPIDARCGGVIIHGGTGALPEQPLPAEDARPFPLFWQSELPDLGYPQIQPEFEPGDVLLLNPWVLHASAPNLSDYTRLSVDCRFFIGSSQKHSLDLQHWQVLEPSPC